jgi:hypothetical protein
MANDIDDNDPFRVRGAAADIPPFGGSGSEKSVRFPRQRTGSPRRGRSTDIAVAIFLPWLVFLLTSQLFLLVYHSQPLVVWVLLGVMGFLALLFLGLGASAGHGTFLTIGFMCFMSLGAGTALGLWLDSEYLTAFWRFEESAEVNSVDPRGALGKTQDAGVVHFVPGAFVDDRRTAGFVSQGDIFCVAPVAMPPSPTSTVGYWAMGRNCCEKRSGFDCGSAREPDSRNTALVMVQQDPGFLEAVREAETVHGVNSTNGAQLVSFTADPKAVIGGLWDEALTINLVAAVVDLVTCVVVGALFGQMLLPHSGLLLPKGEKLLFPQLPLLLPKGEKLSFPPSREDLYATDASR